jgi:superfamily II DNA or RNA helicase
LNIQLDNLNASTRSIATRRVTSAPGDELVQDDPEQGRICRLQPSAGGTSRDALHRAIAHEEARLVTLETQQAEAMHRLAALRAELAAFDSEPEIHVRPPLAVKAPIPQTPADKVRLFRSLFRGREDIFPTRFESRKTGKSGYAPACRNKFVRGVCELPKVKCGDCPNQAFSPCDDAAVVGHLLGRHVMGVYPLLADETCWFLAADFDKSTWIEDVSAFVETCRQVEVPAAVERSRSGNGAHVWFFFSSPVPAASARKMGCYLITETMSRRHELSMDSYDRLFPSQDTMPRGGFGNLIALPLQHGPRALGNSVFLDEQLRPYPDDQQWSYLASLPRIGVAAVEQIAREASDRGSVVGVRIAALDEEDAAPWAQLPSRIRSPHVITESLPRVVRAVLAQKLFVDKTGLPSPLINQIKRLAAFQNPEFYQKQSMRLSTATTPRVIACAEDLPQFVGLPRGCQAEFEALMRAYGACVEIEDQRVGGERLPLQFLGKLTSVQQAAADALCAHDTGVFVAPPGVGKTVVGTYLVAARGCSTLVLVHRQPLLEQWLTQLSLFLGLEPKQIGQIGGGKKTGNGQLDVAMIQSLVRKDYVQDIVAQYGQVIVDECHHLPAVSFERVLAEVKARYVLGLTATPQRRDGHHPIMAMQLGPVRFAVDPKSRAARRPFAHTLVVRETAFKTSCEEQPSIQGLYAALASDARRNRLILDDVIGALEQRRSPILLTERKDHLEYFAAELSRIARHVVVLQGGMSAIARRDTKRQLAAIPDAEERLVLATGRYIGEGFDDARLDTLFLALPVSWKGTLIQYVGRLHRLHPAKQEVRVFDYVDREVPVLWRMFQKRLRGYRGLGYARGEAPLGLEEPGDDLVVEYDEEVLRSLKEQDDFA